MKIVSNVEVNRPLAEIMALMANTANNTKWMHDLESYVPAKDGNDARLTFKGGGASRVFMLRPLPASGPDELRIKLEGKGLTITVLAHFKSTSPRMTQIRFEQEFEFKGIGKLVGFIARPSIHKQQQQHMQDFKDFAERQDR